jgi:hypothetical protein
MLMVMMLMLIQLGVAFNNSISLKGCVDELGEVFPGVGRKQILGRELWLPALLTLLTVVLAVSRFAAAVVEGSRGGGGNRSRDWSNPNGNEQIIPEAALLKNSGGNTVFPRDFH